MLERDYVKQWYHAEHDDEEARLLHRTLLTLGPDAETEFLVGQIGDHFVGIHIGGSAGAGLKNIHHKLAVMFALHNLPGSQGNCLGQFRIQQTVLTTRPGLLCAVRYHCIDLVRLNIVIAVGMPT